jgi:hypothetical protein
LSSVSALTGRASLRFLAFGRETARFRAGVFFADFLLILGLAVRRRTFFADFAADLVLLFFFDAMNGSVSPRNAQHLEPDVLRNSGIV